MALLKETPRSLRQYFGFVAALHVLGLLVAMRAGTGAIATVAFWEGILSAIAYLYIVVRFSVVLRRPTFIKGMLALGIAESVAWFGYAVTRGGAMTTMLTAACAILIYAYLWRSVARLSAEENAAAAVAAM